VGDDFSLARNASLSGPRLGVDAGGGTVDLDPVAGHEFLFDVPTLNADASLGFTIDVTALSAAEQSALVQALAGGALTLAVKDDAPGSAYQAFAVCQSDESALDGCVEIDARDAEGNPIPADGSIVPASVSFLGVVGHFSTAPGNQFPVPTAVDTTKTEMVCIPTTIIDVAVLE
jgi:hypothetical protein